MGAVVEVGKRPFGKSLSIPLYPPGWIAGFFGASGSAKSSAAKAMALSALESDHASDARGSLQMVVIDLSAVSWRPFEDRVYLVNEPELVVKTLKELYHAMLTRSHYLNDHRLKEIVPTPEKPYTLLIIEELPTLQLTSALTASEKKEIVRLCDELANQQRKCAQGTWLISQSANADYVPRGFRVNLNTRCVFRMATETECKMASGDRLEECSQALTFTDPGEMMFCNVKGTLNRFVAVRSAYIPDAEIERRVAAIASDKRPLDWNNFDFIEKRL